MASNTKDSFVTHTGGCHCSAVKFEVVAPAKLYVYDCNCSICNMKSNVHFVVPSSRFKLLEGAEQLTTYTFNTHKAKHMFCKICGVQSFYIPRSNPDGYGINPRCLDQSTVESIEFEKFDGTHWETSMNQQLTKPVSIQSRSK
uniref:Centromere protein V-like n=1 Tax=Phallusia mammillata TaxID=59560 RepID=A0A6F9D9M6_9ASCI|nr:centromere protein V-like [Phallusia mammillata]